MCESIFQELLIKLELKATQNCHIHLISAIVECVYFYSTFIESMLSATIIYMNENIINNLIYIFG